MAPFDIHRAVDVASTRVLSHDETAVLVEAGYSTPLQWFINQPQAHHKLQTIEDLEPAKKRRKTSHKTKASETTIDDTQDLILLARITLGLQLPSESSLSDIRSEHRIPVVLRHIQQKKKLLSLRLASIHEYGAVLDLQVSEVEKSILDALKLSVHAAKRPAVRCHCSLVVVNEGSTRSIKLESTIYWKDGVSAFPAGVPVGATRYYKDYATYSYFFPDATQVSLDHSQPWSPRDFYESVHTPDKSEHVQLPDVLEASLFPFQKRAVSWMMAREDSSAARFNLFQRAEDATGQSIYHNSLQAMVTRTPSTTTDIPGGILAEEMGLGKTVEIMALVAGRPSTVSLGDKIHHRESDTTIRPSKATLIITPPSILRQWTAEFSEHAPNLSVHVYTGLDRDAKDYDLDALANAYDVVLTSFQTLTRELHFVLEPPKREMRHARKYERPRSPLMQLQWWRICLDEAQLIESGVTAAARVARRLPRVHSWAVSGTPVRNNIEDLFGLLLFLDMRPFSQDQQLWTHMITNHRHLFRKIFGTIALRHTKAQIREDIQLPPQKRVVMTLPFTAVESQHYTTLFQEMCEEVGVNTDGSPSSGSWDPDDPRIVESMRTWLVRLRQTCLHPQVGGRNRRRLGRGNGPLRTVAEVLDVMIDQNESLTRTEERAAINALLLQAHVVGNAREDQHRAKKALELYQNAKTKSEVIVADARARLAAAEATGRVLDEDSTAESSPLQGGLRVGLRSALQLLHVCTYFAATAMYQIKVNEDITVPDSEEFRVLEQQETELYEQAKVIRREILKDAADKSERTMAEIKTAQRSNLPDLEDLEAVGGIESRRIVNDSYPLFDVIQGIKPYIIEWKAKIVEILSKPLVDEDEDGKEITGDEYEDSTKQQDELYVYLDALKALQADLHRCITGETAPLIDHEAKTLVKTAKQWLDPDYPAELKQQPHAPELLLELFEIRQGFRSKLNDIGSIRGLIAEARHLGEPSTLGVRAAVESELAQKLLRRLQVILSSYTKALASLSQEVNACITTQNQRLEFYRQLQELSDDVSPYKDELDETLDHGMLEQALNTEELCISTLAQLKTKHRFLMHLKEESSQQESARICVICQSSFDNGVLTVCGHQYCKDCIRYWWTQHRTCPVCKRKLALIDFHNITYKPKEVKIQEETQPSVDSVSPTKSIYSVVDAELRDQIQSYDLQTSYGTKIDTLARHLLWIREHDPGAKSIVFSQYKEFLDVLSAAFTGFKIGHERFGRRGAVESFRRDPSIDCLLLDAKTDSSGLTLVNATHVFVCEPLVQTAVELQAIARVHRIGQVRPTTVWMYLVNDTVEESIYEISVARRMAHVQARRSGSSTPALGEQVIEAADSEELQNAPLAKLLASGKGSGELVEKNDLWQCLFGKTQKPASVDEALQGEVDRGLRARAAENRAAA